MRAQFHDELKLEANGMDIVAGGPCNWEDGDLFAVICAVDIRKEGAIARSWGLAASVTRADENWSLGATSDPTATPPRGKPNTWKEPVLPGPFQVGDSVRVWATAIVQTTSGTQFYAWPDRATLASKAPSA
jgi:hypothetical protein